jgi:acyl carrier protein
LSTKTGLSFIENFDMDNEKILNRLRPIYIEIFKEEIELNLATSPNDIGSWDSLNHILLIKRIEEEFQFEFDLFEVIELKNTGDIVNTIQKYLSF